MIRAARIHPVPAVRDLIRDRRSGRCPSPDAWKLEDVRHFWTVYGNYRDVASVEGLAVRSLPRVLNCPASALSASGGVVQIPRAGARS